MYDYLALISRSSDAKVIIKVKVTEKKQALYGLYMIGLLLDHVISQIVYSLSFIVIYSVVPL